MATNDQSDFEQLYREHIDGVLAYVLSRTNKHQAVEAAESTFLVAWQRFEELPDSPRAWLIGVARRVLADQRRADGRREALGVRILALRAADYVDNADPATEVAKRTAALAALDALTETDRELLCMSAWDNLSDDEAAKAIGCSKSAFKVRLHRARRRFESALSAEEESSPTQDKAIPLSPFQSDPIQLVKETI